MSYCQGKEKVFGETYIFLKHLKTLSSCSHEKQYTMTVWPNRASVLPNRGSVSSKQRLTLAKKDLCLHQTEPLFEANRASAYVLFYYLYSLCSYVSTLMLLRRPSLPQIETNIARSQNAAQSTSHWFSRCQVGGQKVILWNNFFCKFFCDKVF